MNPFATATQMLAALRSGKCTAEELVGLFQARHARYNDRLNAIVTPDHAAALARASDAPQGTLGGLPLTVKDAINVAGLPTTGGIRGLAQALATADAPNVRRLREAGALILGKTNTPVANGDWQAENPLFGRTLNPWNPALSPGGSTGGGAAALAAGLSAIELGSDVGGSIRVPAAFCGLFGHKPSAGALASSGHFPARDNTPNPAQVLGAQGPLARGAADLELLFETLCAADGLDAKGWRAALPPPRFAHLSQCRVGVLQLPDWLPVAGSILDAQQSLCDGLAARGASVRRVDCSAAFGDFSDYYADYLTLVQCLTGGVQPATARERAAERLRGSGDRFLDAVATGLTASAGRTLQLLEKSARHRLRWESLFETFDVLLSPVCSSNAFPHQDGHFYDRRLDVDGTAMPYYRLSVLPAIASLPGLPVTVFPTGRRSADGAPVGLQVMGAYLEDRSTLAFARLVEAEFGGFTPPPGFD